LLWEIPLFSRRVGTAARRALTLALGWILLGSFPLFAASSTTVTMAVTSGGTAVTSVSQDTVVALTATVLAGSTPVTVGQVNFCDASVTYCTDIHLLSTAQLTSAGTAAFKFRPGPGSHSYKAVFVGTTTDAGSTSATTALTVTAPAKIPTTTTITQSGNNSGYSLTATVYGNGSTAPTGTVSFLDTSNANAVVTTATLGAGTGLGFLNTSNPAVGGGGIAAGDFNGDGIPDLIVSYVNGTSSPGSVGVLLGNGDGTFKSPTSSPATGIKLESIAVGDWNGDGNLDVAVANAGSNTVTVLLGNGSGTLTATAASPATGADPVSIAVGDFNGDGILDLAVANANNANVTILLGNGDGTFTATAASPATGDSPYAITAGDFNGDGKLDLATANNNSNTVTVLLGNGDGTFTPASASPATGNNPNSIVAGDFNGDGKLDLAVSNLDANSGGTITVLLGNGNGTFTPAASPATGGNADSIAVGDWNGDGIADLAVANQLNNALTVLLGVGDCTFTPATASPATSTAPSGLAVADFNGDGLADLAVANAGNYPNGPVSPSLTVLLASGQVTTAIATGVTIATAGPHLVEASYPGDSNYASSGSATTALTGPTAATTLTLTANPSSSVVPGGTVTLTATLSPSTYKGHSSDGETVTFSVDGRTMGTGTLSGDVATFLITSTAGLQGAGALTLSAQYAGDNYLSASLSNSIPFSIASPVSTTLALTVNPTTLTYTVGDSIGMTATLTPASYEGASSDGSTVVFSYSNGMGNEQGGSGQVAGTLSAGVATASANSLPAGVYSVQATFAATTSFAASTSPAVVVTVNKATATISLTSSANPAAAGQSVTLTATLSFQPPANPLQQQETVTFYDGSTLLATEPVTLGPNTATLITSALSAGAHSITAQYSGDIDNLAATSAPLNQGITTAAKATPSIALTSSANPALVSAPVTFTASVTSTAGTPPGSVTFFDGTTQLGSATVSAGAATYSTSTLALGTHTITAVYSGDSNFASVTSAPLTETIETFTLSAPGGGNLPAQTASPGGQANYLLAVDPPSGTTFVSAVTFTVTGLPAGATATFSPTTLPAHSGAASVTMTVTIPSQSAASHPLRKPFGGVPLALGLFLLPFAGPLRKGARRLKSTACLMLLGMAGATLAACLTGCGSSGSMGGGGGTPKTYTLSITATSGSQSNSTTVNLTVE
jgi:hypothetical protein